MADRELYIPDLTHKQAEAVAVRHLESLAPGRLPTPIFYSVMRLVVGNTVEVGLVKPSDDTDSGVQILLTQRPSDDPHWPNQWHIPGSFALSSDEVKHEHDHDDVIGRVLAEVGGDVRIISNPVQFDAVRRIGLRGSELTVRILAQVEGCPDNGRFFDAAGVLRRPPEEGLLDTHAAAIQSVADRFALLMLGK